MAEKSNSNIGFEKQIWDATCVLWSHIPAAEYRKMIIGLIFLRYISSAFEKNITSSSQKEKALKKIVMSIWEIIFSLSLKKQNGLLLQLRLILRKSEQSLMKQ